MAEESRQVLPPELQKAAPKLVLDANGNFTASDMPGLFYFPQLRSARLENGRGTWKLEWKEGKRQIQLDFHSISGWKQMDLPFGTQLYVAKEWSSVSLYYFLGDPDEGKRIGFGKK